MVDFVSVVIFIDDAEECAGGAFGRGIRVDSECVADRDRRVRRVGG